MMPCPVLPDIGVSVFDPVGPPNEAIQPFLQPCAPIDHVTGLAKIH
jgi:hypothetical protein